MTHITKDAPKDKYRQMSELGSKLNLAFSSHMSLNNKIIAMDGVKKKLLVMDNNDTVSVHTIIDLNEVRAISVKKNYSSIKPGELKKRGMDEFLEKIYLQFESEEKTVAVPFYELGKNNFTDLPKLERNARTWQMILMKMIAPKNFKLKYHETNK
jgi:hypothetical protein